MYDNFIPTPTPDETAEFKLHSEELALEKEYKPSKQDLLRDFPITIKFLNRGCIVGVGCKEIAFSDINEAMVEINQYITGDTWEVQKKWRAILDN
jgi:hypothetical protein